jgi:hypothetical protein
MIGWRLHLCINELKRKMTESKTACLASNACGTTPSEAKKLCKETGKKAELFKKQTIFE